MSKEQKSYAQRAYEAAVVAVYGVGVQPTYAQWEDLDDQAREVIGRIYLDGYSRGRFAEGVYEANVE